MPFIGLLVFTRAAPAIREGNILAHPVLVAPCLLPRRNCVSTSLEWGLQQSEVLEAAQAKIVVSMDFAPPPKKFCSPLVHTSALAQDHLRACPPRGEHQSG